MILNCFMTCIEFLVPEDLRSKFLHELREHRRSITLWRSPLKMLGHFIVVVAQFVQSTLKHYGHVVLIAALLSALAVFAHQTPGAHTPYLLQAKEHAFFVVWWVGLGIASSVGLGSGLHTFVLYLGPHIAQVAMAATSCNTLDFATSGPLAYKCTLQPNAQPPTVWDIFLKVQMACFLWGVGTAIGELPPYFMSRAAAQAGEKLAELNELEGDAAQTETFMDRAKAMVLSGLQRYGFWAILACASIPNPLFDLAGLASGHFGVPFATFFGATVIGKAGIKAHGQTLFVIMVSSKQNLQRLIDMVFYDPQSAVRPCIEICSHSFFRSLG
jgi:membrane protein YqaA with SNARE-associated domain